MSGIQLLVADLQGRYSGSESTQLEMLCDHMLKTFKDVTLEWNKTLADKSLDKVWVCVAQRLWGVGWGGLQGTGGLVRHHVDGWQWACLCWHDHLSVLIAVLLR